MARCPLIRGAEGVARDGTHRIRIKGLFTNEASGLYSSVSGGNGNEASGGSSSVSGGYDNWAGNVCTGGTNPGARCLGDGDCTGGGTCSTFIRQSVSGGLSNNASGSYSSVSGGGFNQAIGPSSSVSGGDGNTASGGASSVSGGDTRSATGQDDWAAGALWQDN